MRNYAKLPPDLRRLPTNKWTPIAYRSHDDPNWVAVPDAPITVDEAHELLRDRHIFMFNRREPHCTAIVVMRRAA